MRDKRTDFMRDPLPQAMRFRRRLRSAALAILDVVAPNTTADLQWTRAQRAQQASPSSAVVAPPVATELLTAVVDEAVARVQSQLLLHSASRASWGEGFELERIPHLYQTSVSAARPNIVFHIADCADNGVSVFGAKTLPFLPAATICAYGVGGPLRVQNLPEAAASLEFGRAEVFVLGNSPDHAPVLHALLHQAEARARSSASAWLYLHDVSLKHLLDTYFGFAESQRLHRECYGSGIDRMHDSSARLLSAMSGVRLLCELSGARGVVCHSHHAADLLRIELSGLQGDVEVATVSHPRFDPPSRISAKCCTERTQVTDLVDEAAEGARFFGAFGVPFTWKRPADVIQIGERLYQEGLIDGYLFAGWDAEHHVEGLVSDSVAARVFSRCCENCLLDLMACSRGALQLRDIMGGESSGVLAQLRRLGIPTVSTLTFDLDGDSDDVVWLPLHASVLQVERGLRDLLKRAPAASTSSSPAEHNLSEYLHSLTALLKVSS